MLDKNNNVALQNNCEICALNTCDIKTMISRLRRLLKDFSTHNCELARKCSQEILSFKLKSQGTLKGNTQGVNRHL
jgi:hypothetical protein